MVCGLQVMSCLPIRVMRTAKRTTAMMIELELSPGVRYTLFNNTQLLPVRGELTSHPGETRQAH